LLEENTASPSYSTPTGISGDTIVRNETSNTRCYFIRFEELQYKTINYAKILSEGRTGIDLNELSQRNFGQVLGLKLKDETTTSKQCGLIITNTHLFWNWKYQFVKLKQMETLLREVLNYERVMS